MYKSEYLSAGSWIKGISVSTDQTFQECIADNKLFMHGESFKMILTTCKISTQKYHTEVNAKCYNTITFMAYVKQ